MPSEGSYAIRIRGRLTPALAASFPGMRADVEADHAVLTAQVADVAALQALLDRLADVGVELVALRRAGPPSGTTGWAAGRP